jgi:hypothetical protein
MNEKNLPIIPSDRADDLHNLGIADSADLVLFMAGNQLMTMDELIAGFQQEHPNVKDIFYGRKTGGRHHHLHHRASQRNSAANSEKDS